MSITKTSIWTSNNFQENYGNYFSIEKFNNYNSGSFTKSESIFNITSPVNSSTWGTGISIPQGLIVLPYEYTYRVSFDAYVPSTHTIVIDINNLCGTVSGNDHDTGRTVTSFSIPATTWTTVTWGSANTNTTQNPDKLDLIIYDGIGLCTSEDTATINWQLRNPRILIYKDQQEVASIGKNGTTHSNIFYEI